MEWAWLAPALSFGAFGLIVLLGRYLPGKGAFLAILAIAGAFGVFWYVLNDFLGQGVGTYGFSITWFELGDSKITWGLLIDPLTMVMLGVVSLAFEPPRFPSDYPRPGHEKIPRHGLLCLLFFAQSLRCRSYV